MSTVHQQPSMQNDSWNRVRLAEEDPARTRVSLPELRELASDCGGPHVSIYLPTHERGNDVRQDPTRFQQLLDEAERRLESQGLPEAHIEALLRPAHALIGHAEFWGAGRRGLAVLLSDTQQHVIKLPHEVAPACFVSARWRTSPLLPLVEDDRFILLAFSRAQVRLYAGDRDALTELPLGDIPGSLEALLGSDVEGASLQFHGGAPPAHGRRPAMFHGSGAGKDDREPELEKFLHAVAVALPNQMPRRDLPLVLAAVERNVAELRRQITGLRVADEAVVGEPSDASLPQLHDAAWGCATPLLDRQIRRAVERIGGQFITARATTDLATVLHSSREGRCDVMLVALDSPAWGTYDPSTGDIELHEERHPDDDDLLDLAVAYALERGTEVHAVPRDEVPGGTLVAALHRY
jgi:hypothetical protein